MMYLWEVVIRIQEEGKRQAGLCFSHTQEGSPYMELAFSCINQKELDGINTIEVNTYYRFYSIFKDMFRPDYLEYPALKKSLTNVMLQIIAGNDTRRGMTREEYCKKMLRRDIQSDCFGAENAHHFGLFNKTQQGHLLSGWLRSYRSGNSLTLFTDMVDAVIDDAIVYHGKETPDEILVYTSLKNSLESEQKLSLLADVFLPIRYYLIVFYEYHFGIIGIDDTMMMDEIAIY